MSTPVRTLFASLAILLACGGDGAPAAEPPDSSSAIPLPAIPSTSTTGSAAELLGTIEATVDGRSMTWYAVSGVMGEDPYASAVWVGETGERHVAAGGFDTREPPLDSFQRDASGMAASYGSYTGPIMALFVLEAAVTAPATLSFPEAEGQGGVYFQWQADVDDIVNTTFWLTDGTLEVSTFSFSGETARLQGTFSGTFSNMGTDEEVEVTAGRFDVSRIPSVAALGG